MKDKYIHICTVVNKTYVFKFLALYYSLLETKSNFKLWTLCVDNKTYFLLKNLGLKKLALVKQKEIEDQELLSAKIGRTTREYTWTSKPAFIYHLLISHKDINDLIYTDADMAFFQSPKQILKEVGNHSVGITHHNFSKELEYKGKQVGEYNSGIVYLKNNKTGRRCSKFWKNKCIEFCYYKPHALGVGDQMYLSLFPKKFPDTYVFKNKAINFGPWSIGSSKIKKNKGKILIDGKPLVCFHFHQFQIHSPQTFTPVVGYKIPKILMRNIYSKYEEYIKHGTKTVKESEPSYRYGFKDKKLKETLINKTVTYIQPLYSRIATKLNLIYKTYKD